MLKKVRLILANAKYCFIRSLEFRNEVIIWTIASITWATISIFSVNIIFGQVDSIAGWHKEEVMILALTSELFISLMWAMIIPSLLNLSQVIRTGGFDFYLLRPVGSRFLSSISRFEFDQYPRMVVLFFILGKLISMYKHNVTVFSFAGFMALLLIGVGLFYCLFFVITTTTFWFTRLFNLEDFFDSLMSAGRFPTYIFGGALRFAYFYIVPVVFTATFPVQFLLGKGDIKLIFLGVGLLTTAYTLSNLFWNFALKHYSSASS